MIDAPEKPSALNVTNGLLLLRDIRGNVYDAPGGRWTSFPTYVPLCCICIRVVTDLWVSVGFNIKHDVRYNIYMNNYKHACVFMFFSPHIQKLFAVVYLSLMIINICMIVTRHFLHATALMNNVDFNLSPQLHHHHA